jgi:glycerate dehydrogenase
VAQHTFALLLYLLEKMRYFDDYVKNGTYSRSSCFSCLDMIYPEIAGKTWGIIGMGAIGQKVAQIAAVFGCKVICYSASGRTYEMPYEQVDFETLLAKSDILSVHAPLNEHTKGLMNYDAFCKMKESAYFINVGRGPIVVEEDLARALEENQISRLYISFMDSCSSILPSICCKPSIIPAVSTVIDNPADKS